MKKGTARISNMTYTAVIAITMLVLLSSLVVSMAVSNDADDTVEFQKYQKYFNNYTTSYDDAAGVSTSINKDSSTTNESKWVNVDKATTAWSESIVGRAYNGIITSAKMTGIASTSAGTVLLRPTLFSSSLMKNAIV